MKRIRSLITILAVSISFLLTFGTAFGAYEWETADSLSPTAIHKRMGEAKAKALALYRQAYTSAPEVAANQTDYDVGYYRIQLKVDIPAHVLYGNVKMTAKSLVSGLDTVGVDFFDNMTIDSVYTTPGSPLSYSRGGNVVKVVLDQPYDPGSDFTFSISYHGTPTGGGFQGFSFDTRLGIPVVSSLSEPYLARTWWPCKDRPDDKADSLDIFVTNDTAYFCASNGNLIDTTRNGDGTWTFNYQVRYPITSYLFSVAISKYTVWKQWYYHGVSIDSMPVIHHIYPDQYSYALTHWNITPYAIGVYASLFGEYPFINEKYGHANFEWGGGMEHQTCTSMGGDWFGFYEPTVVHELAHQWWGDMITCNNWHDIWLNEGFASYCEALYYEVKSGDAAYHSYMAGMTYSDTLKTIYVYDTTNVNNIFDNVVYDKAGWMLHMLRHVVGDSTFFDILRTYYNSAYKFKDVTSAQFQALCESVSGKDLNYFFTEWLYGTYRPSYGWQYWSEPDSSDGKYWTYVFLSQGQSTNPQVFIMPMDFHFTMSGLASDTVTINRFTQDRKKVHIFKTDRIVTGVTIDPENWILKGSTYAPWSYHIIPVTLNGGTKLQPYLDTLISRGGSGLSYYTVISGSLPGGLNLDSATGVISGAPYDFGSFSFMVRSKDQYSAYKDSATFTISVADGPGVAGDANNDGAVNVLDAVYLINYLYKSGPPPAIPALADVDRSCNINILDVTHLINFLYKGGPAPLIGCATF